MGTWSSPKAKRLATVLTLGLASLFLAGCGDGKPGGVGNDPGHDGLDGADRCATPNVGCACEMPGKVVECGAVQRQAEGQIWCDMGHRSCSAEGEWGECEVEELRILPAPAKGVGAQALGTIKACLANPCDPYCRQFTDDGSDVPDLGPGLQQTGDRGITLTSKEGIDDTTCTGIEVVPSAPAVITVTGLPGGSQGLVGEYFNRHFLSGANIVAAPAAATPFTKRLDPEVSFDWTAAPGVTGMSEDVYTVRWTGFIRPEATREYTLCVIGDDGYRLTVDGDLAVEYWSNHIATERCANPVVLRSDRTYPIKLDYFENGGNASVKLRWKHVDAPLGEIIPSAALLASDTLPATITTTPAFAQFEARAIPAGCFDGPLNAVWTVDRLDRSRVDNTGRVRLLAPVAGDIAVTAFVGTYSASGSVQVKVDVLDTHESPSAEATTALTPADPTATDAVEYRYPYENTVFPLGLRAPTVQWDATEAASAVKLSLRYPATGAPTFSWSKIIPETTPGRYAIPQNAWAHLEATAKNASARISLERLVGTQHRRATNRVIKFAGAPVRGKIYYTQYGRTGNGVGTADIMVADPGSSAFAKPVFEQDSSADKCPVCHSMSADGKMFATSNRRYSANGGLSQIDPVTGKFTLISDYTNNDAARYRANANDWRGFAWAAITPDGAYALAANNIWGNSKEALIGITPASSTVMPALIKPAGVISGGNGTGLLARYFQNNLATGWDWRRIDPRVAFTWDASSPGAAVPTSFSTIWTGEVQALTTETYTFHVATNGGVKLTVGGVDLINQLTRTTGAVLTGTANLTRGGKTPIVLEFRDNGGNVYVNLSWSSPSVAIGVIPQTQLYPSGGPYGVLATYYNGADYSDAYITNRLESNINAEWDADNNDAFNGYPSPGAPGPSWSVNYRGQLQAPMTGTLRVCPAVDGTATVTVNGAVRTCTSDIAVTAGTLYPLDVKFSTTDYDASLNLRWEMTNADGFGLETIPSARLFPPTTAVEPNYPPGNGLTATYYDTASFNAGENAGATTRIEPTATLDWGDNRPEHSSAITGNESFSARLTGQLAVPCEGSYDFQIDGDDGGRLWIDGERLVHLWNDNVREGSKWLTAGRHDFKLDYKEETGQAQVAVRWKVHCDGDHTYDPIPSANFFPTGDAGTAGYVLEGGDNQSDTSYFVWQLPVPTAMAPNPPSVDVSNVSNVAPDRWGLGSATMMVPSFSPNAQKLVFVDGDSGGGNGWRKGLSTFDFDYPNKVFKNRKTVVSTWPSGNVMKWPVFESDSRSVIYQVTTPMEACCSQGAWPKYGFMGPTNYFEDPGRLFSVDAGAATPTPVELTTLNRGERALDRNKAYQATMLPQAAGGFRWAVFTSTRPYGNTLNVGTAQKDFTNPASYTRITEATKMQSMLWVSAIKDEASGTTDRSNPAFFLPNQSFSEDPGSGFVNERAYWVADACRAPGSGAESTCDVDEDCCSTTAAPAVCRIDAPLTSPPTRHCFAVPVSGQCVALTMACAESSQCCADVNGAKVNVCDDGVCVKPPSLARYAPANFERIYDSDCESGKTVDWTAFEYMASVPEGGAALEFFAESADNVEDFHTLPPAPTAVMLPNVVPLGTENAPGKPDAWTKIPVSAAFLTAKVPDRKYLKITIRFIPTTDRISAPVLTDWRQTLSCPPGE